MPVITRVPFGRTGHESSRLLFGAVALSGASERESAETLELVLAYGVNHIDTAASYGDSEDQLRPWLAEHRDRFFLATKTGERTREGARESLARSLERMGVAGVDLIQLHNLVHPGEWEVALGPGGALEALLEARAEGLVRFIGVTGHGLTAPWMHRQSLERFPFDSVLVPYNAVAVRDARYAEDLEELLRVCAERGVAAQTIKAVTRGPWGARQPDRHTWYEPLEDQADVDLAVHWVLGREGVFLNTVGDRQLLPRLLDAATRFEARPSEDEMAGLIDRLRMTPLFV